MNGNSRDAGTEPISPATSLALAPGPMTGPDSDSAGSGGRSGAGAGVFSASTDAADRVFSADWRGK